jgi:hypothetical protein
MEQKETFRLPKKQELKSLKPQDYKVRLLVFGSRYYYDKKEFHKLLMDYIEQFDEPILFISGAAYTGADAMIIQWCRKFGYPCLKMPADWDTYKGAAGYRRNHEMAKVTTHGLGFWDGISNGTKHMREELDNFNTSFVTHIVKTQPPEKKKEG